MSYPPSAYKTWTSGEILTASDLNNTVTAINNSNQTEDIDDYSTDTTEMQTTTDPYPASVESKATDLSGELARLRYLTKQITGKTNWYVDPDSDITTLAYLLAIRGYRRPNLTYVSVTTVDVENNTGTSNQTTIIFPDGTSRSVTEDTSSANKYRRFLITAAAEFTSGTEDSGLRSGISEATNTWYAIYAVKSTINTSNFVLAGDTTLPIQANYSTLNTRYGTSGWVYLGLIRNGDNASATGDILSFIQSGPVVQFTNLSADSTPGLRLAVDTNKTSLAYTYSAGTGTTDIPTHVKIIDISSEVLDTSGSLAAFQAASGTPTYASYSRTTGDGINVRITGISAAAGFKIASAATLDTLTIELSGFVDSVLSSTLGLL